MNSVDDLVDVRMHGSLVDYDGDGDMEEGVYYEIEGMREMLYRRCRPILPKSLVRLSSTMPAAIPTSSSTRMATGQ